ncbi:hypothetical protein M427DRAFT_435434 [Gonapodya prolifera JEL478]|uniref:F-box domain-containing protein n=1 Tax=Gonapodya prolifera (strain JEL478) TaxID=1344416 RepID=A0A139A4X8_GONPJ|nr:hypothetical protein M427DRAFT_435434 [Gonapodya prolifera JEL478]|eukprot:KXS11555.1 hypothetical protein M427DRAFT_435434 [Gonapodya prolifera JEL478]
MSNHRHSLCPFPSGIPVKYGRIPAILPSSIHPLFSKPEILVHVLAFLDGFTLNTAEAVSRVWRAASLTARPGCRSWSICVSIPAVQLVHRLLTLFAWKGARFLPHSAGHHTMAQGSVHIQLPLKAFVRPMDVARLREIATNETTGCPTLRNTRPTLRVQTFSLAAVAPDATPRPVLGILDYTPAETGASIMDNLGTFLETVSPSLRTLELFDVDASVLTAADWPVLSEVRGLVIHLLPRDETGAFTVTMPRLTTFPFPDEVPPLIADTFPAMQSTRIFRHWVQSDALSNSYNVDLPSLSEFLVFDEFSGKRRYESSLLNTGNHMYELVSQRRYFCA